MVKQIEGKLLTWPNIWNELGMYKDKGGKWVTGCDTPTEVKEFLNMFGYTVTNDSGRTFTGLNAGQLATIVLFQGFANYLCKCLPELAVKCGIAEETVPQSEPLEYDLDYWEFVTEQGAYTP